MGTDTVKMQRGSQEDPAAHPTGTMGAARILLVDDDLTVAEVVAGYLRRAGLAVEHVADGPSALAAVHRSAPDLVVLDLMLPGMDGLEVCRRLRENSQMPVVMLTALGEESDRVLGLETGADDYVTKPFSPRELVLRVRSVLRRAQSGAAPPGVVVPQAPLHAGAIEVDVAAHQATRDGQALALTVREFDLLAFFLAHPGQAFTRAQLMERVWGWSYGDQSTVTVHVRRLREKVETDAANPKLLITVWGVGYRFDPPDGEAPAYEGVEPSTDRAPGGEGPAATGAPGMRAGSHDTGPHETGPYDTGPYDDRPHDDGTPILGTQEVTTQEVTRCP